MYTYISIYDMCMPIFNSVILHRNNHPHRNIGVTPVGKFAEVANKMLFT